MHHRRCVLLLLQVARSLRASGVWPSPWERPKLLVYPSVCLLVRYARSQPHPGSVRDGCAARSGRTSPARAARSRCKEGMWARVLFVTPAVCEGHGRPSWEGRGRPPVLAAQPPDEKACAGHALRTPSVRDDFYRERAQRLVYAATDRTACHAPRRARRSRKRHASSLAPLFMPLLSSLRDSESFDRERSRSPLIEKVKCRRSKIAFALLLCIYNKCPPNIGREESS